MLDSRQFFDKHAQKWDTFLSVEKKQRLETTVIPRLNIKAGQKVLDIGSGTGILIPYLLDSTGKNGKITALDYSSKMIAKARKKFGKKIDYICSPAEKIPVNGNIYDVAVCYSVFPHFNNHAAALKEIFRVLKPGGRIIVAHSESRNTINSFHKHLGGVVGRDMIPSNIVMKKLMRMAGYKDVSIQSTSLYYIVTGMKPK